MSNAWEKLTHDSVINAVQNVTGSELSGLLLKRNSYINRVFELEEKLSKKRLIVKFYRPKRWTEKQILEEHAFIKNLYGLDNHVIPPVMIRGKTLFEHEGICFAVFPKMGGRALDEFDKEGWINIGQLIGKMHLAGSRTKDSKRIIWRPDTATKHHLEVLDLTNVVPEDFKKAFDLCVDQFIKKAAGMFENTSMIKLHGDIHMGNFIHRPGEGTFIVDFDDMCVGPPVQDMWMLLPDKVENCRNEIDWFLKGYGTFYEFDSNTLRLIPYLQAMRMIHFASWCAVQKEDPGFETHFPEWGSKKYWGQLIRDVNEV
ncbi:MAG: serine/threonine protein kinase [Candidatus Saganbacteria bacterium]|nr:serine/threonine protein kinase [Candidatus Saganbacteria bacterium]